MVGARWPKWKNSWNSLYRFPFPIWPWCSRLTGGHEEIWKRSSSSA